MTCKADAKSNDRNSGMLMSDADPSFYGDNEKGNKRKTESDDENPEGVKKQKCYD